MPLSTAYLAASSSISTIRALIAFSALAAAVEMISRSRSLSPCQTFSLITTTNSMAAIGTRVTASITSLSLRDLTVVMPVMPMSTTPRW